MTGAVEVVGERHDALLRHTLISVKRNLAPRALHHRSPACDKMAMQVRLAQIRDATGRTLEAIAGELGVAISTVQRWEARTMSIPSERLPGIASAYGCKITEIFTDDDGQGARRVPAEVTEIWSRMDLEKEQTAIRLLSALTERPAAKSA